MNMSPWLRIAGHDAGIAYTNGQDSTFFNTIQPIDEG
jgi:hypothetical protein